MWRNNSKIYCHDIYFAAVTLSMTQESYSTAEDSGVVTVCVQLEAGAMEGVTAVVSLSTGTDTALGSGPGADFVPAVDVQVSFESGSPLGSTECVDITITDDTTEPELTLYQQLMFKSHLNLAHHWGPQSVWISLLLMMIPLNQRRASL